MKDRSTIISICPLEIGPEHKPGLNPGWFYIPAVEKGKVGGIVVGESVYHIHVDKNALSVPVPSTRIVESVVVDYLRSSMLANPDAHPGLMFTFGDYGIWDNENFLGIDEKKVRGVFAKELIELEKKQNRYFELLVKQADDDWQMNRQYKTISHIHRAACTYLNQDREWNRSIAGQVENKCPACKVIIDPTAIVCATCKTIVNKAEYDKLKLASV